MHYIKNFFSSFINSLHKFPDKYFWIVEVFIILLITFLINIAQNITYCYAIKQLRKTEKIWDDSLIHSIHTPLKFLIWLLGITFAVDVVKTATSTSTLFELIDPARRVGIVVFLGWFLVLYIRQIVSRLSHPSRNTKIRDKTTIEAMGKLLILVVVIAAVLMLLQEFNIPITGVIAFGGGGAIVVGWAAKDSLANLAGGLMVYIDRPFAVGDWIRSPDKQIEGTVEYIGWRRSRIRTFDKRPVYVPNGIFSSIVIENPSRMTNRRIKTTFGIRYCDAPKIAVIVNDIEEMLKQHPDIDNRQINFAKLVEFADSSLNILLYAFTKTTQWVKFQSVQEDIFLKIIDIVYNKHHASMAFPTRVIEIPEELAINVMQKKGKNYE